MPKPTIAITGANGFLGTQLTKHFTDKGWIVIALVVNPSNHQDTKQVKYRRYDLSGSLDGQLLKDIDYVVHTAYIKQDREHPKALEANIYGAKKLLEASRLAKVKKNIFISSMSAHNQATSAYGKQKVAIEKLFNSKNDINLRCGLIIGQGGIVNEMTKFMRSKHLVPLVSGGQQPVQIVSVHDLTKVIETALLSSLSGTFTVATPRVYTYKEFYQALASRLGTKVWLVPVPLPLLLGSVKLLGALHIKLGITEENVRGLQKLRSVDNAKDLKKLGVQLVSLTTALDKM